MINIKLTIEYDGSRYYGWQKQPGLITVEGEIEKAIKKITKEEIKIYGSGRTDKGVHARGQIANFITNSKIPPNKIKEAVNNVLPKDISIKHSCIVSDDFHSRYHAKGKEYKYLIYNNRIRSSLLWKYTHHIPYALNINLMQKAAKEFIGTYDFASFMAKGSNKKNTVRTIYDLNINKNDKIIQVSVKGNGFLYKMVRTIVGTLLNVGRGYLDCNQIYDIIKSKDRRKAGKTAPAKGLYLEEVYYDSLKKKY